MNVIKIRCSNTVLYIYLEKLCRDSGLFSSTAIVLDTFHVKYCLLYSIQLFASKSHNRKEQSK